MSSIPQNMACRNMSELLRGDRQPAKWVEGGVDSMIDEFEKSLEHRGEQREGISRIQEADSNMELVP